MTTLANITGVSWAFPAMAWALGGVALPILAHWIRSRRMEERAFPTTRLLSASGSKWNRQRISDVGLLLLRILIVALLAMAAMLPIWTRDLAPSEVMSASESGVDLMVVLDASESTRGTIAGTQVFNLLKARAQREILKLRPGRDRAAIVVGRRSARVMGEGLSADLEKVRVDLDATTSTQEFADIPTAVRLAAERLSFRREARPAKIVVFSDLQASSWESSVKVDESIAVEVMPCSDEGLHGRTAMLGALEFSPRFVSVGDEVEVSSLVRSGEPGIRMIEVEFWVDGKHVGGQKVVVNGVDGGRAALKLKFDENGVGFHEVKFDANGEAAAWGGLMVTGLSTVGMMREFGPLDSNDGWEERALIQGLWPWSEFLQTRGLDAHSIWIPYQKPMRPTDANFGALQVIIVWADQGYTEMGIRAVLKRVEAGAGLIVMGQGGFSDGSRFSAGFEYLGWRGLVPWIEEKQADASVVPAADTDGGGTQWVVADPDAPFVKSWGPGLARALSAVTFDKATSQKGIWRRGTWPGRPVLSYTDGTPALAFSSLGRGRIAFVNIAARQLSSVGSEGFISAFLNAVVDDVGPRRMLAGYVGEPIAFERVVVPRTVAGGNEREPGLPLAPAKSTMGISHLIQGPGGHELHARSELIEGGVKFVVAPEAVTEPGFYRLIDGGQVVDGACVTIDPREQSTGQLSVQQATEHLHMGDAVGAVVQQHNSRIGGQNIFALWRYILLIALVMMLIEMVLCLPPDLAQGRWFDGLAGTMMLWLGRGISVVVLLLLAMGNKESVIRTQVASDEAGQIVIAVDRSGSMGVKDVGGRTRLAVAEEVAARISNQGADHATIRIAGIGGESRSPLVRELGDMVSSMRPENGGQLVVLSDGRDTRGERLESLVPATKAAGVRIHGVPLGGLESGGDTAVSVTGPESMVVGQAATARVVLMRRGYPGDVKATLSIWGATEKIGESSIGAATVTDGVGSGEQKIPIDFHGESTVVMDLPIRYDRPGVYVCALSLSAQPDEADVENNQCAFVVHVRVRPIQVLMLEGSPDWDTKFFGRALRQDPMIELEQIIRLSRIGQATGIPQTVEEWGRYEVVVIGRGMESMLTARSAQSLVDFVRRDGSVWFYRGQVVASDTPLRREISEVLRQLDDREHPGFVSSVNMNRVSSSRWKVSWIDRMHLAQDGPASEYLDDVISTQIRELAHRQRYEPGNGVRLSVSPEVTVRGKTVDLEVSEAWSKQDALIQIRKIGIDVKPSGMPLPMKQVSKGTWRGQYVASQLGFYSVLTGEYQEPMGWIIVRPSESKSEEMRDLSGDSEGMERLAVETGGSVIKATDAAVIAEGVIKALELDDGHRDGHGVGVPNVGEGNDSVGSASAAWWICAVIGVLGGEWILRRRWGLR